ncbi:DUF58 domain-containing protein [Cellulomonas soli]|uniref:Membrane protein n=1 Tax=Cellulomonas soli TaxID=931535 RepID=A0A512PBM4_9CELL|nr:DUF58 domain-containing protein [Cellulomonas soli]NYI60971.1 uncharacterized protein (DUF58 family) [Cellulomonas soli]GEP68614.1 membrane protein [Cellulomonas soli]
MGLRPTARGIGLLLGGVALVVLGVALGTVDVVRMGTLAVLAVLGPAAVLAVLDPGRGRHRLAVVRTTTPNPVHVGDRADVEVLISATDPAARVRLAGLRFAEQAATDLSGGSPLRARVRRTPHRVTVTYAVQAGRRGRWPLGPLVVTRTDPFGVARTSATLGESAEVEVWPRVVPLPAPSDVLVGEPDRVALGARTPSTDDASLREYHEGDDLRRVHWRSSARRGSLMVRSDERAGMRPVSVLLDLPARGDDLEWTISLAASMALAMLEGGHPVRLVGGSRPLDAPGIGDPYGWVHAHGATARGTLLDRTIDLEAPRNPEAAEVELLAATHLLESTGAGDDIVLAVLGPLDRAGRAALAHLGDSVQGWAVVRLGARSSDGQDAEASVLALRRAGWRACVVVGGEDVVACWLRLLGSAR